MKKIYTYVVEGENNKELRVLIQNMGYKLVDYIPEYYPCVVLVAKVKDIPRGLEVIDCALNFGCEVLCIKQPYSRYGYTANHCIKDGANFI